MVYILRRDFKDPEIISEIFRKESGVREKIYVI